MEISNILIHLLQTVVIFSIMNLGKNEMGQKKYLLSKFGIFRFSTSFTLMSLLELYISCILNANIDKIKMVIFTAFEEHFMDI